MGRDFPEETRMYEGKEGEKEKFKIKRENGFFLLLFNVEINTLLFS